MTAQPACSPSSSRTNPLQALRSCLELASIAVRSIDDVDLASALRCRVVLHVHLSDALKILGDLDAANELEDVARDLVRELAERWGVPELAELQ